VLPVENHKIEAALAEDFDEERVVGLGEHSEDRLFAGQAFAKGGHRRPYHEKVNLHPPRSADREHIA
jgi:hypothetical protein